MRKKSPLPCLPRLNVTTSNWIGNQARLGKGSEIKYSISARRKTKKHNGLNNGKVKQLNATPVVDKFNEENELNSFNLNGTLTLTYCLHSI